MRWRVAPSHFCLALVHALSAFGTWFTITATVALLNIKNYISWALTNHGKKKKTEIAWEKQSINFKTVPRIIKLTHFNIYIDVYERIVQKLP